MAPKGGVRICVLREAERLVGDCLGVSGPWIWGVARLGGGASCTHGLGLHGSEISANIISY